MAQMTSAMAAQYLTGKKHRFLSTDSQSRKFVFPLKMMPSA